ncbi:hypothetical protein TRIUR3_31262 [Triticum urartu]|uniref:Late embryogenesis abundant protein LEA-2 subgroup domain-containing protein n=1 Tax=Triticum urartu TaxID=4572 RepID=M8A6Y1_TRIUA|nr:hypothetical protein TRIUR3_31262 [Triticum urartu]
MASVVIAGIVALVLALTVFKVKDPVFTMNRVTLEDVDGDFLGADERHPVSVNATLNADISIKNPNVASFSYDRSETNFYYKGETVGVAYAPDGEVGADRTVRMNVTLDALADRISPNVNVTDLIFGQSQDYDLTSYTEISGRVSVLGIYKRDLDIKVNCSITLEVSAFSSVQSKTTDCVANVNTEPPSLRKSQEFLNIPLAPAPVRLVFGDPRAMAAQWISSFISGWALFLDILLSFVRVLGFFHLALVSVVCLASSVDLWRCVSGKYVLGGFARICS